VSDALRLDPEVRHKLCWYGQRAAHVSPEMNFQTVEDGRLLYCAHPMMFPVVGYHFDVRNCGRCDSFKPRRPRTTA
jgi:hypothetical protein